MEKHAINPEVLGPTYGYTHVITVSGGRTIYVGGQISFDSEGLIVGRGDIQAQARLAFGNLKLALAAAGATPTDAVKIGIFVVGLDDDRLQVVRETRDEIFDFGADPPTSTLLGVQALALPDLLIEVEAIAVVE